MQHDNSDNAFILRKLQAIIDCYLDPQTPSDVAPEKVFLYLTIYSFYLLSRSHYLFSVSTLSISLCHYHSLYLLFLSYYLFFVSTLSISLSVLCIYSLYLTIYSLYLLFLSFYLFFVSTISFLLSILCIYSLFLEYAIFLFFKTFLSSQLGNCRHCHHPFLPSCLLGPRPQILLFPQHKVK